jgi:hypothetical protein
LQLPIFRFATALRKSDISTLQRHSSKDFNRQIWKHVKTIPGAGIHAPRYLEMPMTSLFRDGDKTMVVLGGPANGAKVLLTTEFTRLVIDDVLLIAGVEPRQQAQLKKTMRFQISGSRTAATVIQTGHSNRSTATTSRRFSTSPVTFSSGLIPDDSAFQSNSLSERPLPNQ